MKSPPTNGTSGETPVRYIKVKSRLSKMVSLPDGSKVAEAIKRAEERVAACKDASLQNMSELVSTMQTLCAELKAAPNESMERKLYLLSNELYSTAGMFGQLELSEAAYSLCDLLGNRPSDTPLVWEAVNVHVATLRMLMQAPQDEASGARASILEGLKRVTARSVARD